MKSKKPTKNDDTLPLSQLAAEFDRRHEGYCDFAEKLHRLLKDLLKLSKIDVHALEYRTKTPESFREKIQRPDKSYRNPLEELPDLIGLRIIAYYPDDIKSIQELLKREFNIDPRHSTNKATELAPDQFGYLSVHEVISLGENRKSVTEWKAFGEMHAEVQIRTVLQHAWASISHKIQYKREIDVPKKLRRKLLLLSGLLELADEQFSEIRNSREELALQLSSRIENSSLDLPIDNDSLREYLQTSLVIRDLILEVVRFRFELITEGYDASLSHLAEICRRLGIKTIEELDILLQQSRKDFSIFFDTFYDFRPFHPGPKPFWVGTFLIGNDHGRRFPPDEGPWNRTFTEHLLWAGVEAFTDEKTPF